jgi:hypothetical protein
MPDKLTFHMVILALFIFVKISTEHKLRARSLKLSNLNSEHHLYH